MCAVYPNQRLTVVGQDAANATFGVPGWPFGLEGGILLMGEQSLAFACKVSIPFTLIFWALLTKGLNVYLEPGRLFTQLLG